MLYFLTVLIDGLKKYLILTVGLDCHFHDYNFGVKFWFDWFLVLFFLTVLMRRKKNGKK